MVFFGLQPRNRSVNSDMYYKHLDNFNESATETAELVNRKGIGFNPEKKIIRAWTGHVALLTILA